MNIRTASFSNSYLFASFLSLVLSCGSSTKLAQEQAKPEPTIDPKIAEAQKIEDQKKDYQNTLAAILRTCHRNGKFIEREIEFAKEPTCQKNLTHFCNGILNVNCSIYNEIESIRLHLNKEPLPKEFSLFRSVHIGNVSELTSACELSPYSFSEEKSLLAKKNKQTELYFKNTPVCQQQVKKMFANDWQGLVENHCNYELLTDSTKISCNLSLPSEFSEYQTYQAFEKVSADMLSTNCSQELSLSSSKSIFFPDWFSSSSCGTTLHKLNTISNQILINQDCFIYIDRISCNNGLSPSFAALRKNPLKTKAILSAIYANCVRVGTLGEKSIDFLPSDTCEQALFAAVDDLPAFSSKTCEWKHLYEYENHSGLADGLTLTCKQGLPKELERYTTRKATNAAYEIGLKTYCKRIGFIEKNRILFANFRTCLGLLNEALVHDWIPSISHECKNPQTLESNTTFEFVCEKGLPSQITETFRGQDAPPKEKSREKTKEN